MLTNWSLKKHVCWLKINLLPYKLLLKREKQLHDVTRTISRSMEIDTVLSELLRQTLEITNADEAHLGLIDSEWQTIHFHMAWIEKKVL